MLSEIHTTQRGHKCALGATAPAEPPAKDSVNGGPVTVPPGTSVKLSSDSGPSRHVGEKDPLSPVNIEM